MEGPLQIYVFYADRKSKMATTAGHRLTLDPMGKYSNAFFSETTNMTIGNSGPDLGQAQKCGGVIYRLMGFQPSPLEN